MVAFTAISGHNTVMAVNIGQMIRFHRKRAGLSQEELAHHAGLGKTVIFDLEKGKETVRLSTLLKVLYVLNLQMKFEGPLMEEFEHEG